MKHKNKFYTGNNSNTKKLSKQCRGNHREKAFQDFRHHRITGHWYKKEAKYIRKMTNRKFRRMLKQNLYHQAYYRPRNRDYRTYGWLTW